MVGMAPSKTLSESFGFCWDILPNVSRTFALTIPVLDKPVRDYVAVSYLLCRIADTIEDSVGLPPERRAGLFSALTALARDPGDPAQRDRLLALWEEHPDPHYQNLVAHSGTVLDCYASLPREVREPVADCVREMISGMRAFPAPNGTSPPIEACRDLNELEIYCHYVAGTVGRLLSRLFALQLGSDWMSDDRVEQGRRFGLGLQLTNVLKDHQSDWGRGISYIPLGWLEPDRRPPRVSAQSLRTLIERALSHMDTAHRYVLSLPVENADMRLFCLWAAHLALATLRLIAEGKGSGPVKVTREELWVILQKARESATNDDELEGLQGAYRGAVRHAMAS
jgi:farnesyl-diphosphate farnesyltransferase